MFISTAVYSGEYFDLSRGEYYLRARHFNPTTGRFTQPDPFWNIHNIQGSTAAIMQAANLYLFVMNNPIAWLDPLGLAARAAAERNRDNNAPSNSVGSPGGTARGTAVQQQEHHALITSPNSLARI